MENGHPITRFSLAPLTVPYAEWSGKTALLCDGKATPHVVPGCVLKAQYQSGKYFLLVTEYDCLFEEAVSITLVADDFTPLASATVPPILYPAVGAASYFFEKLIWKDSHHFDLYIEKEPLFYRFTIRDFAIPLIRPRLGKRIAKRPS